MNDTDLDRITAKFTAIIRKDVDGKLENLELVLLSIGTLKSRKFDN
jgi:hypothetical protein